MALQFDPDRGMESLGREISTMLDDMMLQEVGMEPLRTADEHPVDAERAERAKALIDKVRAGFPDSDDDDSESPDSR